MDLYMYVMWVIRSVTYHDISDQHSLMVIAQSEHTVVSEVCHNHISIATLMFTDWISYCDWPLAHSYARSNTWMACLQIINIATPGANWTWSAGQPIRGRSQVHQLWQGTKDIEVKRQCYQATWYPVTQAEPTPMEHNSELYQDQLSWIICQHMTVI